MKPFFFRQQINKITRKVVFRRLFPLVVRIFSLFFLALFFTDIFRLAFIEPLSTSHLLPLANITYIASLSIFFLFYLALFFWAVWKPFRRGWRKGEAVRRFTARFSELESLLPAAEEFSRKSISRPLTELEILTVTRASAIMATIKDDDLLDALVKPTEGEKGNLLGSWRREGGAFLLFWGGFLLIPAIFLAPERFSESFRSVFFPSSRIAEVKEGDSFLNEGQDTAKLPPSPISDRLETSIGAEPTPRAVVESAEDRDAALIQFLDLWGQMTRLRREQLTRAVSLLAEEGKGGTEETKRAFLDGEREIGLLAFGPDGVVRRAERFRKPSAGSEIDAYYFKALTADLAFRLLGVTDFSASVGERGTRLTLAGQKASALIRRDSDISADAPRAAVLAELKAELRFFEEREDDFRLLTDAVRLRAESVQLQNRLADYQTMSIDFLVESGGLVPGNLTSDERGRRSRAVESLRQTAERLRDHSRKIVRLAEKSFSKGARENLRRDSEWSRRLADFSRRFDVSIEKDDDPDEAFPPEANWAEKAAIQWEANRGGRALECLSAADRAIRGFPFRLIRGEAGKDDLGTGNDFSPLWLLVLEENFSCSGEDNSPGGARKNGELSEESPRSVRSTDARNNVAQNENGGSSEIGGTADRNGERLAPQNVGARTASDSFVSSDSSGDSGGVRDEASDRPGEIRLTAASRSGTSAGITAENSEGKGWGELPDQSSENVSEEIRSRLPFESFPGYEEKTRRYYLRLQGGKKVKEE